MTKQYEVIVPKGNKPAPKKPQHPPIPLQMMQFTFKTLGRVFPKLFANVAFKFFTSPRQRAKHRVSDEIIEQANIYDLLMGRYLLKIYEWGSGDKTILLAHGWESRGTALRSFVPQLVEAGYRVVAFDGPAHGNSSGKRADLPTFAGAIKALINRYENVKGIIAHSFGGATTIYTLAKLLPEFELEKLVMIGTPSWVGYPVYNALRTMNAPPKVRKYFVEKLENIADMDLEDLSVKNLASDLKIKKVLIVHDRQDEMVKFEEAETIMKYWKKAKLQETNGFGHFRLMKDKQVVDRVVEFIKE